MINLAHMHLILVHFPIVLFPVALAVLIAGKLFSNPSYTKVGSALVLFAAIVLVAGYLTGEDAEEIVEHLAGVVESNIEHHEDAAIFGLIGGLISGVAAIGSLFLSASGIGRICGMLLIPLVAISSASLAWVGFQGGKIRHPEAYDNKVVASAEQEAQGDQDGD